MLLDEYYIDDFFDSRKNFINIAKKLGWTIKDFPIKATGPQGEKLSIAIAYTGLDKPQKCLCVLSGTHGVEASPGAAIQSAFLSSKYAKTTLPNNFGIMLVHAVNPFGWCFGRRQNEENVDLNRNFQNFEDLPEKNPNYVNLAPYLNPQTMDANTEKDFKNHALEIVEKHGQAWLKNLLIEGQYSFPKGLNFGGDRATEANIILTSIFKSYLSQCTSGLIVDLHTGMGEFGDMTILSGQDIQHDSHRWITKNFNSYDIRELYGLTDGENTATKGKLGRALSKQGASDDVVSFTLEFGTYESERVFLSTWRENWLFHYGDKSTDSARAIINENLEVFNPRNKEWRSTVVAKGLDCLERACDAVFND